jgi:hypothetical protein
MRKYHVRFGGGPGEKGRSCGTSPVAYPTCSEAVNISYTSSPRVGMPRCRPSWKPTGGMMRARARCMPTGHKEGMMSGLVSLEVGSVIACLAAFCCMAGFIHTMHAHYRPSPPPAPAPPESAAVVCAACLGGLSGLESHCPTCGRRLRYQVPEAISTLASPVHEQDTHHGTRHISRKEGRREEERICHIMMNEEHLWRERQNDG